MKVSKGIVLKVLAAAGLAVLVLFGCSLDSEKIHEDSEKLSVNNAPADLTAKALSSHSTIIVWSPVKKAEMYYVYRSKIDGNYTYIGKSDIEIYEDEGNPAVPLTSNTRYFYKISSIRNDGTRETESFSDSVSVVTLAEIPAELNAKVNSASSITITWSQEDANGYVIYRNESETGRYIETGRTGTASDVVWQNDELEANTRYFYKVSSINSAGELSPLSDFVSALTMLSTPVDLAVVPPRSSSAISIDWNIVPGASGYHIYRRRSDGDEYIYIGSSQGTGYFDNDLPSNRTYHYKVSAFSSNNTSLQSEPMSATTLLRTPANLTLGEVSAGAISFSWEEVEHASFYRIHRSESENGEYHRIATNVQLTNYTDDMLLRPNTRYFYRITAHNDNNESNFSLISAMTMLRTPGNLTADEITSSEITISWDEVAGASGYRVYRSESEFGEYIHIGAVSASAVYKDNDVSPNTRYFYRVSALSHNNTSAQSSSVSAMTLLKTPTNLMVFAVNAREIYISWDRVEDAEFYRVYRSESIDGDYIFVGGMDVEWFAQIELEPETTYYYKVSAHNNDNGYSLQSTAVWATTLPDPEEE